MLLAFVEYKQSNKHCRNVEIKIGNQPENHFLEEGDVLELLSGGNEDYILGKKYSAIDLKELEAQVKKNRFVSNVQVSHDLSGNILVNVDQARPIARILRPNGRDAYLGSKKEILPMSPRFTARVLLLDGPKARDLTQLDIKSDTVASQIFELVEFINNDTFWKMLITQLHISANGDILMYPQIGKQIIDFGKPENIEIKFKKLYTFYKKIIPVKGWDKYQMITLKYDSQIICE